MEYGVIGKGKNTSEMADKVINSILEEYSRELFNFTRAEFDSIVEYDVLNIMAYYYSKMNAQQKAVIVSALQDEFGFSFLDDTLEKLAMFADEGIYIPLSCKLMDRLGDSRVTIIIYETIFKCCTNLTQSNWNQSDSYSNYLVLINAAFFYALSYKLHVRERYVSSMENFYGQNGYDEFVESLYEKHLDDIGWDVDIELDVLDDLIENSKKNDFFRKGSSEEFMDAVEAMENIRREHINVRSEEDMEGFERIVRETGIHELQNIDIHGFECHFCEAKYSDEKYIIVYQKNTHIRDIIDNEEKWSSFQRDLYREDIRQSNTKAMVYIVYILDDNSDNIPIQIIESNMTYGRKYVFSEDETITFINGIVKTSRDDINETSPVQEWNRILREEHLTACLTEAYTAKKVESYLNGERFDADYVQDDDYSTMRHSNVPQIKWVKSLETTGFRDFCFDKKTMTFGQINLFYGANGSGKTSVLEAIEYALTAEVRRVKDFKVKLPTDSYPKLNVYDTEAGIHTFTPGFSKKNNKEIERVWYGVPIGRTKSSLNENFNRFNAFDSEAAYKFIHESDNSEDSFASMFGNLMFGETVVDHEKKWQRFKRAFNERYTELRNELNEARSMVQYYGESLAQKTDSSRSEEIETGITALKFINRTRLPKGASDRYPEILEEMKLIRKYVEILSAHNLERMDFGTISEQVKVIKKNNLLYTRQRRDKTEEITRLTEENGSIKKNIFNEREKQIDIQKELNLVDTDIQNWTIVQNVLNHKETIKLVKDLIEELEQIERELYYISKIEQRPAIINFLKLDDYKELSEWEKQHFETELEEVRARRRQTENKYNEEKSAFGEREQQVIELRKIGKTLMTDARCPLCGHEYSTTQQLINIIDNAVVVDDEDDNELANSKIVTLSCNTEDESFTVESIADYEEEADISEDEDIVDDFEKKFTKEEENSEGNCKDNTIFRRDGVIVEICGIKLDSLSKTISIGIWTDNESVDTYKIRLKDLYINEKLSKYFNDIEQSISAYGCAYIEGRIEETNNIAYEEIQRIKFLVEIDYEADKELSNSKIVTVSCNTEDESFTVESIADYEEKADIFKEEDTVDVLGENSVDEWLRPAVEMYKASLRGLSKNQNNQNCVLAAYPDIIKNIVRKREKYWEYRLYVEIVIYEYENLREYRNQKVVFGKYEDCLKRIEDSNEFVDFIKSQMDKLLDFIRKIESYVNEDLKEAFGKSGEAGDVHKIIEATEKMMQIYKDMIEWKLSFGNIDADCTCSRMVELLCQVVESALENFDVLYSKMQVAKKQFEDLLAGLITEEELHVDISIPIVVELDEFSKKWNAWTEKYLNI